MYLGLQYKNVPCSCYFKYTFSYFSDGTGSLLHRQDMTPYGWRYTWAAKFNTSSTLLLVAGVIDDVDGSLAIFQVGFNVFEFQLSNLNSPELFSLLTTMRSFLVEYLTTTRMM